jgi:polycystin 1L2
MRQLRVKAQPCSYEKLRSRCLDDYSLLNEEKDSFEPGWKNETNGVYSSSIIESFKYQSNEELDTYVYVGDHGSYSGNGYVYEFRGRLIDLQSNLSELHQLEWIDNQTRAVIIQFSLYNPNVELFTGVTFLMEFLSTGGISPSARVEPMNFYGNFISFLLIKLIFSLFNLAFPSLFQLICIIFYMIFIIYFMWMEVQSLFSYKWSYFRQFWSYIEIGIIVCSWSSIGIYILRYREYKRISSLFEQTNGYVYINLQYATYINDILTYLYGFCCYFGTIKFVRLCRFNQRLMLFSQTLKYAEKELISFSMLFSIVLLAFLCLFYLLFVSKIWACASLLQTAEMLFQMTLLKFDANQLIGAAPFLGPFSFSLFILLVVFVCLSMFLSILYNSFRHARNNVKNTYNEEIFSFMLNRFQRWTGK